MASSQYYVFTPCCPDGHPLFFKVSDLTPVPGVFKYLGPSIVDYLGNPLITGQCYTVESFTTGAPPLLDFPTVLAMSLAPGQSEFTHIGSECGTIEECPCGLTQSPDYHVYSISSCCGGASKFIYTLGETLDTSVINIYTGFDEQINEGCYTITELFYSGPGVPPYIFVTADQFAPQIGVTECNDNCLEYCPPCTCVQVEWTGANNPGVFSTIRYIDCDFTNQSFNIENIPGTLSEKFCYTSWISPLSSDWTPAFYGPCIDDGTGGKVCFGCYKLVDCKGEKDDIYSLNPILETYAGTNQVITIAEAEGCWLVEISSENCDCAISTTITGIYDDCPACDPIKGYKLTECTTGQIIYTTTDLSNYTSVYITTDCPGCWEVEPLDIVPPTVQPVAVDASFGTCELCNATYYQLTACAPDEALDPIVTITDLSAYEGLVITLASCPDVCWFVEKSDPVENPQVLQFLEKYDTCVDCVTKVKECKCTSAVRSDIGPGGLRYVDCNGGIRTTPILQTGERSEKLCTLYWITGDEIIEYGTCIEGQCPTTPQPKRAVTPGYNTPVCSTDYYEKVECAFGESMYKDVLSERYGISNCCPENDMKWIIKHEMLMLDILVNPDYECTPITTCACPTINGIILNTVCPEVTSYLIERCYEPGVTEVVRIEDQYDVLGNVIVIDGQCYTVIEPTNRLVTVYWTPGSIYGDCLEAGCIPEVTYNCVSTIGSSFCEEVQGAGGEYLTLAECEEGCQPLVPRCMSYVADLTPTAQTTMSVTYKNCNGDIVTYEEYIGEEYLCYQFCALEDLVPIVSFTGPFPIPSYPLSPIRECTDNDFADCVGVNFRVAIEGTGTVTYTDCAGQTQVITYDGTEPIGHLTYACLAPPYDYTVEGTVDIKDTYGSCKC